MADASHADAHAPPAELPKPFALGAFAIIGIGLLVLCLIAGLFFAGWLPQRAAQADLEQQAKNVATATAHVRVARPKPAPDAISMSLPATLAPNQQATIYARATGFVKAWHHDLGDRVQTGEVLADIDAPDTDQDLAQAKAAVAQAQATVLQANASVDQGTANQKLAQVSLDRLKKVGAAIASQQDIDSAQATLDAATATVTLDHANVTAAQANVAAANANVDRLTTLVGYEKITAPFAGIITSRQIQVGSLVTNGTGSGQELFQISQNDPMLVFVNLPQPQTVGVSVGAKATVAIREFGDATFSGTVSNIAGLLDPNAHTMVVELQIPNADGRLLPGMYATATISVPTKRKLWVIPANALMMGSKGAQVAVVMPDSTIHIKPVTIDLDTGANLLISSGLDANDQVALDPGENVVEGAVAEIVQDGATATGAAPAGASASASAAAPPVELTSATAAVSGSATPSR
jgi:RND family efflux transporter MFP subunit